MVCNTCKTAIEDTAEVCPYCKTKFGIGRLAVMVVLILAMAVLAGATMLYLTNAADDVASNSHAAAELPHSSIDTIPTEESDSAQESILEEEQFTQPEPTPTPPSHSADTSRREDEVWEMIESMAITANDYYDRAHTSRVIISKNGYLYNFPARNYYTPRSFSRIESMKPEYADEQVLLLYMRPDDIKLYLPDSVELSGHELELFCGYEVRDGFALARREGRLGIISREDFQTLLAKYSDERGGAFRHDNDSPAFAEIVAAVGRFKGIAATMPDTFDVRYLVSDSKYAIVVLSEKNSPEKLEKFVLVRDQGDWRVDFSGFENTFMYQKVLNNRYPDFNIGILPNYNLYYSAKEIRSNITPLLDAMRTQGVIGEEDGRETFATGTDRFCYMEFESGKKLLAVYTDQETGWMVHTIPNFLRAEMIMAQYEKDPPTFILKQ